MTVTRSPAIDVLNPPTSSRPPDRLREPVSASSLCGVVRLQHYSSPQSTSMSILSAKGPRTPAEAKAYGAALLDLLGTQNPLQVLAETSDLLREDLRRIPMPHLDRPEAPGKWSARMVIAHLADVELVSAYHLRLVLAENRPVLAQLDQDTWAQTLHYDRADLQASLDRFTVLRNASLALVHGASPADMLRVGLHTERGEETLEQMQRLAAGHDLAHRHQLARLRILITGH